MVIEMQRPTLDIAVPKIIETLKWCQAKFCKSRNPQAKEAHARINRNKKQFSHASVPCMSPLRAAYAIITVS